MSTDSKAAYAGATTLAAGAGVAPAVAGVAARSAGAAKVARAEAAPAAAGGAGTVVFGANDQVFASRRSPLLVRHGAVCSSQPLASNAGVEILKRGGNAVDAAVAVAAALNVTEPCSTGLGGDAFCLYYDAKTKRVSGLNASGACPAALTLDKLKELSGGKPLPDDSVQWVTVPGACAGWCDALDKWGSKKVMRADILAPAIALAEDGFPVHPVAAYWWDKGAHKLQRANNPGGKEMLMPNGQAPRAGELMRNPTLAHTLRTIASEGKTGFYGGAIGSAIVKACHAQGSVLSAQDLLNHKSDFPEPITTKYRGVDVWEIPPNGQGLTALIALNIIQKALPSMVACTLGSAAHLHVVIEAIRLAFADTRHYIADPKTNKIPVTELLSDAYATKRAALIDAKKASVDVKQGAPEHSSDTVYFCVVDAQGNACSFINSNYMGFGTGIVPQGCGFTLQNRGHNFSLDPTHPNALAPGKRPYHTIIPGMATLNGELYAPFGVMGGFMQPQGHVQVLMNMIDFGLNPQNALDVPRFCIEDGTSNGLVSIEDGTDAKVIEQLKAMGHNLKVVSGAARGVFGRGQIIRKTAPDGVLWCGSDGRADGCAAGY